MKKFLEAGDVIKTNPLDGYWVCSLVLSSRGKTQDFSELCHIAVTNAVFEHDFHLSEIDFSCLKIIHRANNEEQSVPCISVYASRIKKEIEVLGNTNVSAAYNSPLNFEIGDGAGGGWPHCGPVRKSIGFEAVHQWRILNDRKQWLVDIEVAEKSHHEMLKRLSKG